MMMRTGGAFMVAQEERLESSKDCWKIVGHIAVFYADDNFSCESATATRHPSANSTDGLEQLEQICL
jgi:hypothetical protein